MKFYLSIAHLFSYRFVLHCFLVAKFGTKYKASKFFGDLKVKKSESCVRYPKYADEMGSDVFRAGVFSIEERRLKIRLSERKHKFWSSERRACLHKLY